MRTRNRFKFDEGTDENKENMPEKKRPTSTLARGNSKQKTKEGRSGSKNEKATRSNTDSVRKSVRFSEVDRQQKDSKGIMQTSLNNLVVKFWLLNVNRVL